ncbi:alkane 1-monooxygenase [Phenylobacterium sp.]|uniref:alkane 1-monooxygenase n=1 Tax=Phenylobacterium sp. TaxID=1871053 RepID=UPI002F3EC532
MKTLRFGSPFLFLASAPLGYLFGGAWAFVTVALVPVALCALDLGLGFEAEAEAPRGRRRYRSLPYLYIAAQLAVTVWAGLAIARPGAGLVEAIGLTISVGVTAGIFGICAAHEMVHSPVPAERALGLLLLASVGYMHFRIAHIHGHHVRAATFEDPATARRGESAYRFMVRSVVGQGREAWRFETARLRRGGRRVFGPSNRMLVYFALEALLGAGIASFGLRALVFWVVQAVLAIALLEMFNYIAHYGLARRPLADGGLERLGPRHSWNSSRRMNNRSLFNMGRHSNHHRRPTQAYQGLAIEPEAPELPSGYAGAILLALTPPLWRRVMDPRVDLWMDAPAPIDGLAGGR